MEKHVKRMTMIIILSLLMMQGSLFSQTAEKPFFIADDKDFSPYCSANEQGEPEGIFYDVISEAFRRMNTPFTYKVYPWKRAQLLVKNGEADAMITVPTPERLKFVNSCEEPIVKAGLVIFVRMDNPRIEEIKKIRTFTGLQGYKLVDYLGDGWAERNLKDLDVDWAKNMQHALKMLALNRADIFVQSKVITRYNLKQLIADETNKNIPFNQIIELPYVLEESSYNLLIRKDSPHIAITDRFNQTIRAMRRDGTMQRIYDKYINN